MTVFDYFKKPAAAVSDMQEHMLRQCSWRGDGAGVHCVVCGEGLRNDNIKGMDEDGNAYCGKHNSGANV